MFGKMFYTPPCENRQALDALKNSGSNISKPHLIEFWFDFHKRRTARKVARLLRDRGFNAKILPTEGKPYICRAGKEMIPSLRELRTLTREFDALAYELDGTYDGWSADIVE